MLQIKIKKLPNEAGAIALPAYQTSGNAGMDLRAVIGVRRLMHVGETMLIPLGFAISIPEGFEAQIRPKSGLALIKGIMVPNSPGTIDSDFRGEVKVILTNNGLLSFEVVPGMRIAQMVIAPVIQAEWDVVDDLDETERGAGGYGSTGKN